VFGRPKIFGRSGREPTMNVVDDFRRLTHYLQLCSETGSGAHLTASSLDLLLLVLHAHIERGDQPHAAFAAHPFQIVATSGEEKEEILALSSGALIAKAIFDEAVKQRPSSKIRLRYGPRVLAEAS
jgi:hypothetical protein